MIKNLGFILPEAESEKISKHVENWLRSLINLVSHEIRGEDSPIFDTEYNISQKIKTTIPWQSKKHNDGSGKRQRVTNKKAN